jgi:catalase
MTFRPVAIGALSGLAGLVFFAAMAIRAKEPPRPDQLVDALSGVFGKHPGVRAAHSKGICVTGMFTPSPDAPELSKAPQFAKPVPIVGRFSLGGGNPQASDNAQRGLAVRFDLGKGANSDLLMISAPAYAVSSIRRLQQ